MTRQIPSFRSDYFFVPAKKDQEAYVVVYSAELQADGSYQCVSTQYDEKMTWCKGTVETHPCVPVKEAMQWVELKYMQFNEHVKSEAFPGKGLPHYTQFMKDVFPPTSLDKSSDFRSSYFVMRGRGEDSVTVFVARQGELGKFTCVEDNFVVQTGDSITDMQIGPNSGSGVDFFEREVEGLSRPKAIAWIKERELEMRVQNRYYVEEQRGSDVPHVLDVEAAMLKKKSAPKKQRGPKI